MDMLQKKIEWWESEYIVHSSSVSEPLIADNWFTVRFTMDAEHKASGQRHEMSELAVYQTRDGKIIREEYFYDTGNE